MGKKTFSGEFSVRGINDIIRQLEDYQKDLVRKTKEYCKLLSEEGLSVAEAKIAESPLGHYVKIRSEITAEEAGCKAVLVATGEVKRSEGYEPFNTLLAIEFGAGIHFNPKPNPKADEFGLGVGTFPGQIHAFSDGWYYWDEASGEWRYTRGVKATMPMYSASMEIVKKYVEIARTVFK